MAAPIKNLTGQRFGRLIVLYPTQERNKSRHVIWMCQCDCGNMHKADGTELQRGNILSCGCYAKEQKKIQGQTQKGHPSTHIKDYTGYRSGKLIALRDSGKRNKSGNVLWECLCDCGNTAYVSTSDLKAKSVQSCGCLRSVGEANIQNILEQENINFKKEYSFKDCTTPNGDLLRFDFAILDTNNVVLKLIEFNGPQHYQSVEWFGGEIKFQQRQLYDQIKRDYAKQHNIPLLIIDYSLKDQITKELLLN